MLLFRIRVEDRVGSRVYDIDESGEVVFSRLAIEGDAKITSLDDFTYELILPNELDVHVTLDGNAIIEWDAAVQHHRMLRGRWQCVCNGGLYQTDEEFELSKISLNDGSRIVAPGVSVEYLCVSTSSFASLYSAGTVWDTYAIDYYAEMAQDYHSRRKNIAIIAPNQRYKKRSEYEAAVGHNLIGYYNLPSRSKSAR